jgi:hypothetical protein
MAYTIPARTNRLGSVVPEIIVDDEFRAVLEGCKVFIRANGYPGLYYDGRLVSLYRLLWTLKYGSCPKMLDHINTNKLDNRLENLRPASFFLNNRNKKGKPANRRQDLPQGVAYQPLNNGCANKTPYCAQIKVRKKAKNLGGYATPEEAGAVYQAMKFMLVLVESALCQ